MIPLPPADIHGIWKALKPFAFESTYGGFPGQNVQRGDLKEQVLKSMQIFLRRGGHVSAGVYGETV
jgi:predicted metal-dependent RNase